MPFLSDLSVAHSRGDREVKIAAGGGVWLWETVIFGLIMTKDGGYETGDRCALLGVCEDTRIVYRI